MNYHVVVNVHPTFRYYLFIKFYVANETFSCGFEFLIVTFILTEMFLYQCGLRRLVRPVKNVFSGSVLLH